MKFQVIFLLIIMASVVSAENITDEKFVCDKVFYFLIENQDFQEKIGNLLSQINERQNITNSTLHNYIYNYSRICPQINQRNLPYHFQIGSLGENNETICDYEMNYSLFGDSSVLQASIPVFSYYMNSPSCEKVERWKWIVGIEKVDTQYKVTGIRVYFIICFLFLIGMVMFLKSNLHVNKLAKKVMQDE